MTLGLDVFEIDFVPTLCRLRRSAKRPNSTRAPTRDGLPLGLAEAAIEDFVMLGIKLGGCCLYFHWMDCPIPETLLVVQA
jgi:hypothetical protein